MKTQAISGGPRLLPDAQCVIAVCANFWREPLITNDRIAVSSDQSALGRVRHELWIILEVVDHCTDGVSGRVNRADSFKLLERRTRTRAAVDRDIVFSNGDSFQPLVAANGPSAANSRLVQPARKMRHQTVKNSLVHRAMIHRLLAPAPSDTGC